MIPYDPLTAFTDDQHDLSVVNRSEFPTAISPALKDDVDALSAILGAIVIVYSANPRECSTSVQLCMIAKEMPLSDDDIRRIRALEQKHNCWLVAYLRT